MDSWYWELQRTPCIVLLLQTLRQRWERWVSLMRVRRRVGRSVRHKGRLRNGRAWRRHCRRARWVCCTFRHMDRWHTCKEMNKDTDRLNCVLATQQSHTQTTHNVQSSIMWMKFKHWLLWLTCWNGPSLLKVSITIAFFNVLRTQDDSGRLVSLSLEGGTSLVWSPVWSRYVTSC